MTGPDLAASRAVCLRFPEAEEAELQGRPLFRVRRRRFALVDPPGAPDRPRWRGAGPSLHVATEPAALGARELAELVDAADRHVARRRLVEILDRGR